MCQGTTCRRRQACSDHGRRRPMGVTTHACRAFGEASLMARAGGNSRSLPPSGLHHSHPRSAAAMLLPTSSAAAIKAANVSCSPACGGVW